MSNAQGMVDLLWIYMYNESYLDKKNQVDCKQQAKTVEEKKEIEERNKQGAKCYRYLYVSSILLNVILGIALVVCIYKTKKNGTYESDGFSFKTVKFWVVIGSTGVNLLQKIFLGSLILMIWR